MQRNNTKGVTDQRSKDMGTRTKRMTAKEVGRSRRDGTVRVDVRRHGLGVQNARAISMHREQLIDKVASCRKVKRCRGCDARPGLMTYLRRKGL
jgi:hypothetical protein